MEKLLAKSLNNQHTRGCPKSIFFIKKMLEICSKTKIFLRFWTFRTPSFKLQFFMLKYITTTILFSLILMNAYSQCGVDKAVSPSFYKRFHNLDRALIPSNNPDFMTDRISHKKEEGKKQRQEIFKNIATDIEIDILFRLHISENSKTKKIDEKDRRMAINNLNDVFAPIKVRFNERPHIIEEKSTTLLNINSLKAGMMTNILVIDVVDDIIADDGHVDGYASLPNDEGNYILIVANDFKEGSNSQILIHEIGHYFGLMHTFGSVKHKSRASPNSDCTKTGDFICDTPFDINLAEEGENNPYLTQSMVEEQIRTKGCYIDIYGNSLSNLPFDNFMSYYDVRSKFTSGQYSLMKSVIQSYKPHLIKSKVSNESIFVRDESKFFSQLADQSIERGDKGVVYFVTNDSIQWCNRLLNEIRQDQCLSEAFSKYTTCLYDVNNFNVDEVRDRMAGGGQDGFSCNFLQDSVITAFKPQLITYPQILVFKVTGSRYGSNSIQTRLEKIILGYHKPQELCKILEELSK